MDASINGCLENINKSYKAFGMPKQLVKDILEFGKSKQMKYTSEIPEEEIDRIKKEYYSSQKPL